MGWFQESWTHHPPVARITCHIFFNIQIDLSQNNVAVVYFLRQGLTVASLELSM